jgi:hypothetical protein
MGKSSQSRHSLTFGSAPDRVGSYRSLISMRMMASMVTVSGTIPKLRCGITITQYRILRAERSIKIRDIPRLNRKVVYMHPEALQARLRVVW